MNQEVQDCGISKGELLKLAALNEIDKCDAASVLRRQELPTLGVLDRLVSEGWLLRRRYVWRPAAKARKALERAAATPLTHAQGRALVDKVVAHVARSHADAIRRIAVFGDLLDPTTVTLSRVTIGIEPNDTRNWLDPDLETDIESLSPATLWVYPMEVLKEVRPYEIIFPAEDAGLLKPYGS